VNLTAFIIVRGLVIASLYGTFSLVTGAAAAEPPEQQLQTLLAQRHEHASDPAFLIRLADLCLDVGDDGPQETTKRRAAYEEGAALAKQALELQERNADAHYLYAANLGSAAQLKGMMASAFTVQELLRHGKRALELNPHHRAALHMMGRMLDELPWVLGGDATAALGYLRRAVAEDPAYLHARVDLAKAYLKRKDVESARKELAVIMQQPLTSDASPGERRHRAEAQRLQDSLSAQ
jgi:tetratricopeptide (TPR) repeat protein